MNELPQKIQVKICMGTACFVLGAAELQDLEDQIPESWRNRIEICYDTCLELCKKGGHGRAPFVLIDREPFAEMTSDRLLALLKQRLIDNETCLE